MQQTKKLEIVVVGSPDRTELAIVTPATIATSQLTRCLERAAVNDAQLGPARWLFDPIEQTNDSTRYLVGGTIAGLIFGASKSAADLDAAKQRVRAELEREGFDVTVLEAA
jgi:hypothetical protein